MEKNYFTDPDVKIIINTDNIKEIPINKPANFISLSKVTQKEIEQAKEKLNLIIPDITDDPEYKKSIQRDKS
jgi:hypothetical protein